MDKGGVDAETEPGKQAVPHGVAEAGNLYDGIRRDRKQIENTENKFWKIKKSSN